MTNRAAKACDTNSKTHKTNAKDNTLQTKTAAITKKQEAIIITKTYAKKMLQNGA